MRLSGLVNSSNVLRALKQFKIENKERCGSHAVLGELELTANDLTSGISIRCIICSNIVLYGMTRKAMSLKDSVATAISNLMEDIPSQQDFVIQFTDDFSDLTRHLSPLALVSINEIKNTIRLFGPENVYLSFNGGKDATVAMHLYLCAYYDYFVDKEKVDEFPNPKMIFFKEEDGFDEVNDFVSEMAKLYSFDIKTVNCCWKEGIKTEFDGRNNIAFVMGSRKTDPGKSNLECLKHSDLDESSFLLVNVLREWSFGAVWSFILHFKLPYCTLYDKGYTSIGKKSDTLPNESLREGVGYRPAYRLANWDNERVGRQGVVPKEEHRLQRLMQPMLTPGFRNNNN